MTDLDDELEPLQPAEQWAMTVAEQILDTAAARLAGEATAAYWNGLAAARTQPKALRLRRSDAMELTDSFLYRYLDDHAPGGEPE